jgi:serine/threonine protein kinase
LYLFTAGSDTVMKRTTFLGHYRISVDDSGAPRELGRAGPAITYEGKDERSGETVALKLIPVSSIDPAAREQFEEQANAAATIKHVNVAKVFDFRNEGDHFVYVSELLQGEPLASWVAQHGPMPADAVLRVAEQIVSVLSTARFHKLAHCAIEPSNLIIVPGSTPEGSWPFVKLMDFPLPGLKSGVENLENTDSSRGELNKLKEGNERKESFSVAPPFASPEQLQHGTVDFRSEVYSLGATMYFLLTGAAPSPEMRSRSRELSGFPKALRNLIVNMLRRDPDQRPKDPVALAEMIRECLVKIERRQALARKLGVPLAAKVPRKSKKTLTPLAQVLRGVLVFAAILLAAGVLGAFLLPTDINPFRHRPPAKEAIGVPIGVPETSPVVPPQPKDAAPIVANQSPTDTAASSVANEAPSPGPEQQQTQNADLVAAATPPGPPEASPNAPATEPENSTQAQDSASASRDTETPAQPAIANETTSSSKKKSVASAPKRARATQHYSQRRRSTGSMRARVVGITSDGRLIFRSSSGRTLIVTPGSEDENEFAPSRRRRDFTPRDESYAPSQPFPPDYFPDD